MGTVCTTFEFSASVHELYVGTGREKFVDCMTGQRPSIDTFAANVFWTRSPSATNVLLLVVVIVH